ncbi:hypothetical protein FYK55_13100 [Roseiconus nitratireducens]|uniref:Uncharacterized protein n=1 Tax=Roseiconus nitratireducens TaxID=2605748 RepID=A0A5M6DB02_9BACT|nr:hypothetical protein [Roseiconus nitratireducens]KAA5543209.1 hypothetical protein FYK55_13100 [Roseiconus nitratireducens]
MAEQQIPVATRNQHARLLVAVCVAVTLISCFTAAYFAGQSRALRQAAADAQAKPAGVTFPKLDATAAVTSEKFSMATGLVSDRAEGLFVLDHNSGLLQCSVMYPRLGKFLGQFTVNVQDALGTGKGSQYMMTTGLVDMPSSNNNPIAASVVYVLNASTGAYACYYIPFNRVSMNANRPQQGQLVLLSTGSADPVVDRDNLR